jgi:hypothetical protein
MGLGHAFRQQLLMGETLMRASGPLLVPEI